MARAVHLHRHLGARGFRHLARGLGPVVPAWRPAFGIGTPACLKSVRFTKAPFSVIAPAMPLIALPLESPPRIGASTTPNSRSKYFAST